MSGAEPAGMNRCPQCGTEFSGRASPLGLCPACLLKLGMSDPAWTPPAAPDRKQEAAAVAGPATTEPAPVRSRRLRFPSRRASVVAAAVVAVALLSVLARLVVVSRGETSGGPPGNSVRFSLPFPDETDVADGAQFAVSPDGRQIVLAARGPGGQLLWVRALESTEWRALSGTEGAVFPFWSPDSRDVGFFAGRRLKRVHLTNGLTYTLTGAPSGRGGGWGADDRVVFAPNNAGNLLRVPSAGGTPEPATVLDGSRQEVSHLWPHVLPDFRQVVYVAAGGRAGEDGRGTMLSSLDTDERRLLVPGGGPAALARGFLLYVRESSLLAQPYDPHQASLTGDAQFIRGAERLGGTLMQGAAFSVSSDVLVYRNGGEATSRLEWFTRDGREVGSAGEPGHYRDFSLSPDGARVAVTRHDERDGAIWLLDLRRNATSRVTSAGAPESSPIWSPDGTRIAFASVRDASAVICVAAVTGGGKADLLLQSHELEHLTDWSPDGRMLLYSGISPKTGSDLWGLPLDQDRKPLPIVQTPFNESQGHFSPDGRWVAYVSDQSGRDEVYVQAFPPSELRWQVSSGGGSVPKWRRDGRELFFVSDAGQLMAVDVDLSRQAFQTGEPRPIFAVREASDYEVSADGNRFLVKATVRERGDRELQVVLNWVAELRR